MINKDSLNKWIGNKLSLYQSIPNLLNSLSYNIINVCSNHKEIINKLRNLSIENKAIYIITAKLHDNYIINYEEIKNEFKLLKANHSNAYYHISKINKNHFNSNKEITLYVGSKRKSVSTRLVQHLGLNNKDKRRVYSLYLNDWWNFRGDITITIISFSSHVTNEQLQIIEDFYWDELKPFFGKKGGNNNSEI